MTSAVVGQSAPRVDLRDKLTGDAQYSAGLKLAGMLISQVQRSPHPHAGSLALPDPRSMADNEYKVILANNLVKNAVTQLLGTFT